VGQLRSGREDTDGRRTKPRRIRVERGIYRQPNGNFAVCARRAGRLHFRTAGTDLIAARRAREDLIAALETGRVPASPRLRFHTVAARWSERFETGRGELLPSVGLSKFRKGED
jgi:hypothetical protein